MDVMLTVVSFLQAQAQHEHDMYLYVLCILHRQKYVDSFYHLCQPHLLSLVILFPDLVNNRDRTKLGCATRHILLPTYVIKDEGLLYAG